MVEYNRFYTIKGNPLISDSQIATLTSGNQYIKTGYIDFTKPFRLSVTYNLLNTASEYKTLLEIKQYGAAAQFKLSSNNSNAFILTIGNTSTTSSFSYDTTKTYVLTFEWDGNTYRASFNSTDGVHTLSVISNSATPITIAYAQIGSTKANIMIDLKSFIVSHLNNDYEYRLVEEVKPISNPDTVKGKLEYLEDTKNLIIKSLRSKGININDNTTFRDLFKYIIDGFDYLDKWSCFNDYCFLSTLYNSKVYLGSSTAGQSTLITNGLAIYDTMLDNSNRINIKINNSSTNWQSMYSEKYRNSIFSLYQNGTNTSFYTIANRESNLIHPTLGYFITDETGRIINNIPVYDEAYAYKPDKYVENFLTYNPSDMSVTIKAGDYQSCYTKPITEAIINVDTDKVLSFDESMVQYGNLAWSDADYRYNLQVSPPSNRISMSLLNSNNPDIPNYIISRKMRTTGDTSIRLYNSSSTSYYQNFTTRFVDISPNVLSTGTVQFRSGSSSSFGFANIGDQYIIRTEVGDGFRNNVNPDYIYEGSYANQPTSLTHTRQLTLLDGSTRLIDDGSNRNITVNELKNIRYIDDIYTVSDTTSSSASRTAYFSSLVSGKYTGAFSYGINIDTTYNRLSISSRDKNSKVNLYVNVGANLVMEGFSNKPIYQIL